MYILLTHLCIVISSSDCDDAYTQGLCLQNRNLVEKLVKLRWEEVPGDTDTHCGSRRESRAASIAGKNSHLIQKFKKKLFSFMDLDVHYTLIAVKIAGITKRNADVDTNGTLCVR